VRLAQGSKRPRKREHLGRKERKLTVRQVNGDNADPAFEWLKNEKPGLMGLKRVKWNFEKFLVGKDGKVKNRWASTKKPEDLKADIVKELEAK
jgi:glutathione peroxidase-family protein